ncbi:hypothetical protein [Psychrobacter lutiphocae]|uniref:hypothetical protein n=2 Tax=Psychrobacter lutiphocae TaxID=540500 RepID=UPI00037FEAD8|nr:hypothetical protein [Psychrobacter lutiphocae]
MINLKMTYVQDLQPGLCFQIGFIDKKSEYIYENSMRVSEEAFSLFESVFRTEFPEGSDEFIYYHWGNHTHNLESTRNIISKLIDKEQKFEKYDIDKEDLSYYSNELLGYLNNNKTEVIEYLNKLIGFLMKVYDNNYEGTYVIGI